MFRACPKTLFLVGLLASATHARADDIEALGDALVWALPAAAVVTTFVKQDPAGLWQLGGTYGVSNGITYGLKRAFEDTSWGTRPNGEERSFPSGHTSSAFSAAGYLHFRYGWQYGLPAAVAASVVGYTRVEADKHHVRDVVAGALIGYGSAFLMTDMFNGHVVIIPYADVAKPSFGIMGRLFFGPEASRPVALEEEPWLGAIDEDTAPPAALSDYNFRQFLSHTSAVKWDVLAIGTVGVVRGRSGFNEAEDDILRESGGMDALEHAWSTYALSDYLTWRIENNASDPANADLTGAALSMGLIAGIGVAEDISTGDYKYENLLAAAAGAGFSVLRNRVPGLAEKVDFRLEYLPSGDGSPLDFLSDYMGQKYVLALKPAGFQRFRETPLRFLELQVGYYARGYEEGADESEREHNLYAGVGLNVAEIYRWAMRDSNAPESLAIEGLLHHVQVPYTYLPVEAEF
jgi:hypothetical protein